MGNLQGRDLLSLADLQTQEIYDLLALAKQLKSGEIKPDFQRKTLGLLFRKASTRTRVSFSVAMHQLGGHVIDLDPSVTQVSRGEPIEDTARVLDRYVDILAIRTSAQLELETFAKYCKIPIINALSDLEHPCQVLADLLTVQENFSKLQGLTMTYVGDGNNMAHSLLLGCALVGMNIRVATPKGFAPDPAIVAQARSLARGSEVIVTHDPKLAVQAAHVLYTDVWASMGQESEAVDRIPIFQPYQLNTDLMALADRSAIVLHCLPAHRGEEITDDVMEGKQSRIWDEAENRLHAQKALLVSLL
ncbi:ornithine carbamoyltransferase [Tumidithrix elongata RA019]|uniref:Ornithine carbamoyltransferase n=1 Tax=Tumidithrix elongata BACA0141 TaxID=2716417 RepID=A0AAW9Q4B7_9CYAN|nr:ornithine carbamoyltransferase [Tumidithrix elongata RA019]